LKKSELKNIIKEALTPEEASKVAPKYKEFYSGMTKSNPLKLKGYDNPDAMVMGRVINYLTKNRKMKESRITELVKSSLMGPISEKKRDQNDDGVIDSKDYLITKNKAIKKSKGEANEDLLKKGSKISMALDALDRAAEEAALSGEQFKKLMTAFHKEMEQAGSPVGESFEPLIKKVDEAEVGPYNTTNSNKIKQNVKNVSTFATEILRHIDVVIQKEPQGKQMMNNALIRAVISKLKQAAGIKDQESNETRDSKVDEAESAIVNITGNPLDTVEFDVATSLEIGEIANEIIGDLMSIGALKSGKVVNDAYYTIQNTIDKFLDSKVVPNVEKGVQKAKSTSQSDLAERILKELRGNVNEESDLKKKWREWNKNHPKDQIDWAEYEEEHS
jgi:hypothetical protein